MKLFVQKAGHDLITESETRRAQSVGPMYNTCVPESKNSTLISYSGQRKCTLFFTQNLYPFSLRLFKLEQVFMKVIHEPFSFLNLSIKAY